MPNHTTMEFVNTIILVCGTLIVPALVFFVNAQVAKQISKLEERLGEKFEAHRQKLEGYMADANRRTMESSLTHANLDKRITVVENWQGGVQSRLDQLIASIDAHIVRPSGDAYSGNTYILGGNLGIKY